MYHPEGAFKMKKNPEARGVFIAPDEVPDTALNPEEELIRRQEEDHWENEPNEYDPEWSRWVTEQLKTMEKRYSDESIPTTSHTDRYSDEVWKEKIHQLYQAHEKYSDEDLETLLDRLNIPRNILLTSWRGVGSRGKLRPIWALYARGTIREKTPSEQSRGYRGKEHPDKHHKGGETIRRPKDT
jgi:hypothetical protein